MKILSEHYAGRQVATYTLISKNRHDKITVEVFEDELVIRKSFSYKTQADEPLGIGYNNIPYVKYYMEESFNRIEIEFKTHSPDTIRLIYGHNPISNDNSTDTLFSMIGFDAWTVPWFLNKDITIPFYTALLSHVNIRMIENDFSKKKIKFIKFSGYRFVLTDENLENIYASMASLALSGSYIAIGQQSVDKKRSGLFHSTGTVAVLLTEPVKNNIPTVKTVTHQ